jgi:hypothetical protein
MVDGGCTIDECGGIETEGDCKKESDCVWSLPRNSSSSSPKCMYNYCSESEAGVCSESCTLDKDNNCVPDVCSGESDDTCFIDCEFESDTCSIGNSDCVRLHGEEECYDDCVFNQVGQCVEDPCLNREDYDCGDCSTLSDGYCEFNECVRFDGIDECPFGCIKDSNICKVDPVCSLLSGVDECYNGGGVFGRCIYVNNKCVNNRCYTSGTTDCNDPGCVADATVTKDGSSLCFPNPCAVSSDSKKYCPADCSWDDTGTSGKKCEFNDCVRLHNESSCYDGCILSDNRCVVNPCSNFSSNSCIEDCTISGSECIANECTRFFFFFLFFFYFFISLDWKVIQTVQVDVCSILLEIMLLVLRILVLFILELII